jgi:exosortase/archaeosortase family protein
MKQKRVFRLLLAGLAVMLMILPFMVSFNDILTRAVENIGWYNWVQQKIVPLEIKMIGVLIRPLGIDFIAHPNGMTVNGTYARMTWNCIGWQSLFLFLVSLPFGFGGGKYTLLSKIETFIIGLLGTFWVNLLRITFIVILLVISRPIFAVVFHDYLAAIVTVIWLIIFWFFSYGYVLQEKNIKKQ